LVRHDNAPRPGKNGNGVFAWLGQLVVRHPWRVIALWIVAAVAAIIVFAKAGGGPLTAADSAKVKSVVQAVAARHVKNILSITAGPPSSSLVAR